MATRKKKGNSTIYVLAAAGAGALYYFMRPTQMQKDIATIVAGVKIANPEALKTMDPNFIAQWAYAIINKRALFPMPGKPATTWYVYNYNATTGAQQSTIVTFSKAFLAATMAPIYDATQQAFVNNYLAAVGVVPK